MKPKPLSSKIQVLRLFSRIGETSSPYVQFTRGFKNVHSITLPFFFEPTTTKSIASYISYYGRLCSALTSHKLDVIHCHNAYLLPLTIAARIVSGKRKVPLIFTLHTSFQLLKLRNRLFFYFCLPFIETVIACGESVFASMPAIVSRSSKCVTIRNAVNLDMLEKNIQIVPTAGSNRKSVAGSRLYTACRLVEGKNLERLIELFKSMQKFGSPNHLDIYGGGPILDRLKKQAAGDPITLHGQLHRHRLYQEIATQDIYISLSKGEGFPVAPLEALCVGLAAILSDIPPHKELEEAFPGKVLILEGQNYDVRKINSFIKENIRTVPKVNEIAHELFSLSRMEREYINIYRQGNSKISALFSTKSADYNKHYLAPQNKYSKEKVERLKLAIGAIKRLSFCQPNILDIGCGTGILCKELITDEIDCRYYGVDISEGMISAAIKMVKDQKPTFPNTFVTRVAEISRSNFDIITSLGVVGYQKDQLVFLDELANLCQPDHGTILVTLGNGASLLRKLTDFIRRTIMGNDSAYMSTSTSQLSSWLARNGLIVTQDILLLPVFDFLPPQKHMKTALSRYILSHLYMSRFIVVSRNGVQ